MDDNGNRDGLGTGDGPGKEIGNEGGNDLTLLLRQVHAGEPDAQDRLIDVVYGELHRMAARIFSTENPGNSLQPTVLINELWMRTIRNTTIDWQNRRHFYGAAAGTMRQVLIDHARSKGAIRRPNPKHRVEMTDVLVYAPGSEDAANDLLDVDRVLAQLAKDHPEAAEIVEQRYFGGYTMVEIADALNISVSAVKTKHAFAMAWLAEALAGPAAD
jgi:RNA polymerase sigma-70 factor (ECF subfamily)